MQCPCALVLLACCALAPALAADLSVKQQLQDFSEDLEIMKTLYRTELARMQTEIEDLKKSAASQSAPGDRESCARAINELRAEVRQRDQHNTSLPLLLRQMRALRNELKQAVSEARELAEAARSQESRLENTAAELSRLKTDTQQARDTLADLTTTVAKLSKEVRSKHVEEISSENDVLESADEGRWERHVHKIRHNKMVHSQLSRMVHTQEKLEESQMNLEAQLQNVQSRLDTQEDLNSNLLSAKVDILELDIKMLRYEVKNNTQKISDFDKIHASLLELREDLESMENKADKTIPEFRKEISKLDNSFAQLNAQSSYLKEDQENLRQSVKAIAVSVSNAIDRAELDRLALHRINVSVTALHSRAIQHYYRLNDHILKSESNPDLNMSMGIPLPELMGEVKELQPVERKYQDLVQQLPRDCSAVAGAPGVYLIHPGRAPLDTWCDNGTTLLQRRYNGSVEFNLKFNDYVRGFGDPASEYWLGLDAMHRITADNCSSMRIDMTDIYGGSWYAQYDHFTVGGPDSGYVLQVSGFKGNASDAFEYQNHMEFSTIDRDRDISNTHCAGNYEGGWWFSHCQHVNINGKYTLGLTWFDSARNQWIAVATSEMRLRRRPGCS